MEQNVLYSHLQTFHQSPLYNDSQNLIFYLNSYLCRQVMIDVTHTSVCKYIQDISYSTVHSTILSIQTNKSNTQSIASNVRLGTAQQVILKQSTKSRLIFCSEGQSFEKLLVRKLILVYINTVHATSLPILINYLLLT